ncbi:Hsp70 family protein [Myxococcota bacterium]|nr:Hsp70 family protein [Myxococcota bacterium]
MHEDYISIKVRLKYADIETFQSKFAPYVSPFGMFLPSRNLQPAGSLVEFTFYLSNDETLFQGRGRVVATYTQESHAAAGMGLQFLELTPRTHRLLGNILRRKVPRSQLVPDLPPSEIGTFSGSTDDQPAPLSVSQPPIEMPNRPSVSAPVFSATPPPNPPATYPHNPSLFRSAGEEQPIGDEFPLPMESSAIIPTFTPPHRSQPPRTAPPPSASPILGGSGDPDLGNRLPRTAPPPSASPMPPTPAPVSLQANLPPVIQGSFFPPETISRSTYPPSEPAPVLGRPVPSSPPPFGREGTPPPQSPQPSYSPQPSHLPPALSRTSPPQSAQPPQPPLLSPSPQPQQSLQQSPQSPLLSSSPQSQQSSQPLSSLPQASPQPPRPPQPSIFSRTGAMQRPTLGAPSFQAPLGGALAGSLPSSDAPTQVTPVLTGHTVSSHPTEVTPMLSGALLPHAPTETTPLFGSPLSPHAPTEATPLLGGPLAARAANPKVSPAQDVTPPTGGSGFPAASAPISIANPSVSPTNTPSGTMPMPTLQGQAVNPTMMQFASLSSHREELLFFQGKIEDIPLTGPIIGIDLGTTNSCCAIVEEGRPKVIPSRFGYNTIPSIVAFSDEHELLIGHPAKNQMMLNPRNTVYGAKRLIGRKYRSRIVQLIKDRFLYSIVETSEGGSAVYIDQKTFTLEQISALILAEIRDIAQEYLHQPVHRAVISVPAHYNDQQRQAVRDAGLLAGLRVERIVNEPTAAALAYGFGRGIQQRLLVYDLGGGTFDASVLEVDKDVFEVISTGGNTFLGGVDFDNILIDHVIRDFYRETQIDLRNDPIQMQRVRDACEKAKCDLSMEKRTRINIPYLLQRGGKPIHLEQEITRDALNSLVKGLVEETLRVCEAVMKARELKKEDIDEVLLVGGMTRMPLIHERLTAYFGKPPHRNVHPDEAVAIGTALLAHSFGKKNAVRLIDVLALPIGIGLPGGRFVPVIAANTPLPFEKNFVTATTRDNQTVLDLPIFQGESQNALENEYLGTLHLAGIQPAPKGVHKVELQFKLSNECLLTLRATNLQSGQSESVVLSTKDTPDELSRQLNAPKPESSPLPAHQRPLPWPPPAR